MHLAVADATRMVLSSAIAAWYGLSDTYEPITMAAKEMPASTHLGLTARAFDLGIVI